MEHYSDTLQQATAELVVNYNFHTVVQSYGITSPCEAKLNDIGVVFLLIV